MWVNKKEVLEMTFINLTPRDMIKMSLKALHNSNEEHVAVLVDVRNGNVEVLSTPRELEGDWWGNHKRIILRLKKEDIAADIESLYRKHRYEICCNTFEVKERFPHLT